MAKKIVDGLWLESTDEGYVRFGVTDRYTKESKGVVYIHYLRKEGDTVELGEPLMTMETIGGWPTEVFHDIYSPIAGKLLKVNRAVVDDPYRLNEKSDEWILEIEPDFAWQSIVGDLKVQGEIEITGILYTPNHSWARITDDRTVKVGLSEYAIKSIKSREQLGIACCQTEPVGTQVKGMEPFGIGETFWTAFDLVSPVSGKIKRVNRKVLDDSHILNEKPEETWIIEIEPKNLSEDIQHLLSPSKYEEHCRRLEGRLNQGEVRIDPSIKEIDCVVDKICRYHHPEQSALIPILQDVQREIGYLPHRALEQVSNFLKVSPSHIYGVATFYHQFRLTPEGKHVITVCRGTACHVAGSGEIYSFFLRHLRIVPPEDTSPDGFFTIQQVRCIGACGLAPIVKIDGDVYGKLNVRKILKVLAKHRRARKGRKET